MLTYTFQCMPLIVCKDNQTQYRGQTAPKLPNLENWYHPLDQNRMRAEGINRFLTDKQERHIGPAVNSSSVVAAASAVVGLEPV